MPLSIDSPSNICTLQSYQLGMNEYISGTAAEVSGNFKEWIDMTLKLMPPNARIIEIGSGFGRDARYIESFGFTVERTDATEAFIALLRRDGYSARVFNILMDDLKGNYDLVFANAVFLHFTPEELQSVLTKIRGSLKNPGFLAFSVKKGEGEEWETVKLGRPRYFCYWTLGRIQPLINKSGLEIILINEDEKFIHLITKKQ